MSEERTGYNIQEWCGLVGVTKATFYNIVESDRPKFARIGSRVVIYESPGDWLRRMGKQGGAKTSEQGDGK